MKIRMKDNTIRLRLMQQEVERFSTEGIVTTATWMGASPENCLTYTLKKNDGSGSVTAFFEKGEVTVSVPAKLADDWAGTNKVGIEANMPLINGEHLYILIEKDFKCLQERPNEDESDAFPNPVEGNAC
ncbi:hypothetical protein [Cesiribacter sp. SM1]|uniref:DUF7009 family protein n=1 Tax=Cesiribacter sp. SM1 TaxID=2861196 RepID=UPI001CD77531|nr:hypothetical protein [Cesiribacter sp. SM1]